MHQTSSQGLGGGEDGGTDGVVSLLSQALDADMAQLGDEGGDGFLLSSLQGMEDAGDIGQALACPAGSTRLVGLLRT